MIRRDEARRADREQVYQEIGSRIRGIRERQGLTQEALAQRVGLTRTSVTNIEKGRQKFLVHTLLDLAGALGVNVAELLPQTTVIPSGELAGILQGLPTVEQDWIRAAIDSAPEE